MYPPTCGGTLPHALRQIRNFMLASMAEGRPFEDEEEGHKRGDAIVCTLNMDDVNQALTFDMRAKTAQSAHTSTAQGASKTEVVLQPDPQMSPRAHAMEATLYRVGRSTNLAVRLAQMTESKGVDSVAASKNITNKTWTNKNSDRNGYCCRKFCDCRADYRDGHHKLGAGVCDLEKGSI